MNVHFLMLSLGYDTETCIMCIYMPQDSVQTRQEKLKHNIILEKCAQTRICTLKGEFKNNNSKVPIVLYAFDMNLLHDPAWKCKAAS